MIHFSEVVQEFYYGFTTLLRNNKKISYFTPTKPTEKLYEKAVSIHQALVRPRKVQCVGQAKLS